MGWNGMRWDGRGCNLMYCHCNVVQQMDGWICACMRECTYGILRADACMHGWRGASRHVSMQGDVRLYTKSYTIMWRNVPQWNTMYRNVMRCSHTDTYWRGWHVPKVWIGRPYGNNCTNTWRRLRLQGQNEGLQLDSQTFSMWAGRSWAKGCLFRRVCTPQRKYIQPFGQNRVIGQC
jgi:hypothetical protein